tara:strand:+ start:1350 stop:1787 length:438 start_codon:yes stop_codon:yes gene_type:complete
MELAKTDYQNETELSAAREMLERRDAELVSLHTELATLRTDLETLHTVNSENAARLDDIRLPLFKLLKDQLGAMVSGEIAEQLKTNETAFDIQDHMDDIRDEIYHNLDITDYQSEIEEMVSERDLTDDVTEIVEDVLRGAKITIG